MNDAKSFVEVGELTLDFVAHSAWSMLFIEVTLVSPRWTSFFALEECIEIFIDEEGCTCAIAEIAERSIGATFPPQAA